VIWQIYATLRGRQLPVMTQGPLVWHAAVATLPQLLQPGVLPGAPRACCLAPSLINEMIVAFIIQVAHGFCTSELQIAAGSETRQTACRRLGQLLASPCLALFLLKQPVDTISVEARRFTVRPREALEPANSTTVLLPLLRMHATSNQFPPTPQRCLQELRSAGTVCQGLQQACQNPSLQPPIPAGQACSSFGQGSSPAENHEHCCRTAVPRYCVTSATSSAQCARQTAKTAVT
jgi:hypothetical protein